MTPPRADSGRPVADPTAPPRVEMTGIVKRYGDVVANDGAGLRLAAGEIHALVGENGAGKSTLMSVLYGLVTPDGGEIRIDGGAGGVPSPGRAGRAGGGVGAPR